ncbi:SH3 domain-containing protein [Streptomyces acidicola]|uniref:SH3 domain-containing protein n=1 Tax=Streptomyces acidicola TaxID=2596892 RepID=A0A5N8WZT0_9ACTN|nr:SH3 domain-containing protein [Streptomyces acidicola]MPY52254.1 SH3 domain-containing protein [Streptomyces acidicola]
MSVDRVQETEGREGTADTEVTEVTEDREGLEAVTTATVAAAVRYYSVAPGVRLNVRSGPGTNYSIVRVLPEGARVPIYCQRPGERISGPYGTTNIWDNIADGDYISDAYVYTGSSGYVAPRCA